ncbi:MAG: haloalkane dehalogenase [archaeon]|nr:haloalkane dehalogenase [archaeon]
MKLLRTPDECFENLLDFPFAPHYVDVKEDEDSIRIHYVDEGPKDAEPILLMHGEPTWSYLYRHMIPILVEAGYRVLAPDLVGFGKSDKPTEMSDHTYRRHINWIKQWLLSPEVNIQNITLFCQDWGSLISLRVVIDECPTRFSRIVLSNGGLPYARKKPSQAFFNWLEVSKTMVPFLIGRAIQGGTVSRLKKKVLKGYNAPFPDESYKAAPRIMPSLVPVTEDDPENKSNKEAFEKFKSWNKPFLTAFGDGDPISRGTDKLWQKFCPGTRDQKNTTVIGGGHFIQEEKGPEMAEILIQFMKDNPLK